MDLTICIPCFEDASNVDKLLISIYQSDTEGLTYEILVCDGESHHYRKTVIQTFKC